MKKCPNCNAVVEDNSIFCACCGEKLPQVENEVPSSDSGKRCPKCNAVIDEDSVFCVNCGFKLNNGNNYMPIDEETKEEKSKWWLYALMGMIVVAIAGGGLYYWTQSTNSESVVAETAPTDSIKPDVKENAEIDSEETKKKSKDELEAQVIRRVNDMLNDALFGEGEDDDPGHVSYFSKSFKELYDKVNESEAEGEIGYFDHDIWTQSQGDGPTSFEITGVNFLAEDFAYIIVHYIYDNSTSSGECSKKVVKLYLEYEDGNWFLRDFGWMDEDEKWHVESINMRAYIKEMNP